MPPIVRWVNTVRTGNIRESAAVSLVRWIFERGRERENRRSFLLLKFGIPNLFTKQSVALWLSQVQSTLSKRTPYKADTSLRRKANFVPAECHLSVCNWTLSKADTSQVTENWQNYQVSFHRHQLTCMAQCATRNGLTRNIWPRLLTRFLFMCCVMPVVSWVGGVTAVSIWESATAGRWVNLVAWILEEKK